VAIRHGRCQRRGLECVVRTVPCRSFNASKDGGQMLRNDALNPMTVGQRRGQASAVQEDVQNLHRTLDQVCQYLNLQPPTALVSAQALDGTSHVGSGGLKNADNIGYAVVGGLLPQTPIDTLLESVKTYGAALAWPYKQHKKAQPRWPDMITKQQIGEEVARGLVEHDLARLGHFVYGIASHYKTLEDVRSASPALLAAICAVSALQDAGNSQLFEVCSGAFRSIVAKSMFQERDMEYLRALCIASFWLWISHRSCRATLSGVLLTLVCIATSTD